MLLSKYNIEYLSSIKNWDEALPLGNGKIGCLVYGDGPIRLALDRVDLWDLHPHPNTLEEGFNFNNLVKLSLSGKKEDWEERRRLFEDIYAGLPYPSKITAGRLELDFGIKSNDIVSELDLERAIAMVSIPESDIKAEIFLSATRFVGVATIRGNFDTDIHIPHYISDDESSVSLGYPRTEVVKDGAYIYYRQKTLTDFSFGIVALKKDFVDHSELYFTVATNNDGEDFIDATKKELSAISLYGYDKLKEEHVAWWKKYWKKSEISIPDELLEKTYYRSYYLFASCSRKGFYPMPLQGVWTADNDSIPPWKGDYHHDTNTQLSYQSYLKANRIEEGRVYTDYLWNLRAQFKKFARNFYGVDGLLIPGVSTLDGKPMGGWSQYALSPTMTIWVAQSFEEYRLYMGGDDFLRRRAYPFFRDVEKAIRGLLKEKEGKYYLSLSSSPEIFDDTPEAYLEPNSNFDLSLLRYLYITLIKYSNILGIDPSGYELILSGLDEIAIDDSGVIMLDRVRSLNESHRHFSHLMSLYPLHLINYDTSEHKRIYERTLDQIESLGSSMWVGFSFPMCAQIHAMAHNGDNAYEKLYAFCDGFVAENGFHLNGDYKDKGYSNFKYRPFTLEASFGFCDALQEMLLQDHAGYIELFPAIPDEWKKKKVSFKNFRSVGGVLISATCDRGIITEAEIRAFKKTQVKIKYDCSGRLTVSGPKRTYETVGSGGIFTVFLDCGKSKICFCE